MRTIELTQGLHSIVDEEDFERVSKYHWYASRNSRGTKWEARRTARHSDKPRWRACKVKLHHFVLNISPNEMPAGHVVDHINGDSLDNRKSNLEIVTQRVNMERAGVLPKRGHLELPNF
jgi:hypothetical protein